MFSYQLSFFPKILLFLNNLSIDTWKCNRSPNFKLKLWIKGKNAGGYLPIIFFSPIRKPKAIVSIEKVNCRNNCNSSIVGLKFSNIGHFKFWCLTLFLTICPEILENAIEVQTLSQTYESKVNIQEDIWQLLFSVKIYFFLNKKVSTMYCFYAL